MRLHPDILAAYTPTGRLRAAINLGNPILAGRNADGEVYGVSVDLARAFAEKLGASLELVVVESAGKSVAAVTHEEADIGFFAIDPVRGAGITFTEPYVLIQGGYLVRAESPLQAVDEVDRAGTRVTVGQGSAYDLFLTRELKHATITRAATSQAVVETFLAQGDDVAAGVLQQLQADAQHHPGLRLLPGSFMTIRQAMGLPRGRSSAAARALAEFVETMKANGFVADALRRHGIEGAAVAPVAA